MQGLLPWEGCHRVSSRRRLRRSTFASSLARTAALSRRRLYRSPRAPPPWIQIRDPAGPLGSPADWLRKEDWDAGQICLARGPGAGRRDDPAPAVTCFPPSTGPRRAYAVGRCRARRSFGHVPPGRLCALTRVVARLYDRVTVHGCRRSWRRDPRIDSDSYIRNAPLWVRSPT
jgi:hypothetical protein